MLMFAFFKNLKLFRKKVDPETAKYFSQISNLFESGGIDLEERPVICAHALEEAGGKELELSTDKILSRTLQHLLEGCDVNHLCAFLHNCANDFETIATDKSGSHVAETALKSLSVHLGDDEAYSMIESALTKICQVCFSSKFKLHQLVLRVLLSTLL